MSEVVRSVEHEPQFAAFVGIDWADQKQVWCLQATGSQRRESGLVDEPGKFNRVLDEFLQSLPK